MRQIRVISYAINGIGIGHLMRLKAITVRMRELARDRHCEVDPLFITSSEADNVITSEGIPSFKVPSKSMLRQNYRWSTTIKQAAQHCVWSVLEACRPDLLIVDTVPAGSFGEFLPLPGIDALQLCKKRMFIYRPLRVSDAGRAQFELMLSRYDSIIVPETQSGAGDVFVPDSVKERTEWTGPIVSCNGSDLMDRQTACRSLGVDERGLHILVWVGGGGHHDAEHRVNVICNVLRDLPNSQIIVGVGPLYRGAKIDAPNVVWVHSMKLALHLRAIDIAVSAAGYNSFNELMLAGIPTIFLPLEAVLDDQLNRARRAESVGAAVVLTDPTDQMLTKVIECWRDVQQRQAAAEAARALVPQSCTSEVAARALALAVECPGVLNRADM
jgi:predicted glycosyltransferase